ncbi:hypothetical protein TruAng_005628 [Truncatella angustata]|nr:hypothetical protein TruAng_005628 [Truncatella angustata]
MNKQLRPVLPAKIWESDNIDTSERRPALATLIAKRKAVAVACLNCRKRKTRCNGVEPMCVTCSHKGIECSYSKGDGLAVLEMDISNLEVENNQLREALGLLCTRPEHNAHEIFKPAVEQPTSGLNLIASDARLLAIDVHTLEDIYFKIQAQSWTLVAGDDIVSGLISSFFAWDDAFLLPFIDRDAFLDDMRNGSPGTANRHLAAKRVLSKALWGMVCFESLVAYLYLQKSLLPPPYVERFFNSESTCNAVEKNLDIFGDTHNTNDNSPPFVTGTLNATCDLSLKLYEAMT